MKEYKKMVLFVNTVIETCYFHMNMNGFVLDVDITQSNEKNKLSKISGKKNSFVNRIKYAEYKIFCIRLEVCKIYESNDYN